MSSELPLSIETLVKETNLNNNNNNDKNNRNNNEKTYKKERKISSFVTLVFGLRIILICICVVWFLMNAYTVFCKYFLYETIISLRMESPSISDLPGITVCGPYVIHPKTLSHLFPDKYIYEPVSKAIDDTDPKNITEIKIRRANFNQYEQKAFEEKSAKDIIELFSLKHEHLIEKCVFNRINLRHDSEADLAFNGVECLDIAPIVESIYEGRKCFTYFSRLSNFSTNFSTVSNQMNYDMNPSIELTVKINDDLWALSEFDSQVIMTIHPNSIIPSHLDFEYFRIIKQYYYEVYFTKKSSFLKKKPWKTGCKDYGEGDKWKIRENCVNDCIKQFSSAKYKCANYYGVLTTNLFDESDRICPQDFQNYTVYIEARRICAGQCPPECTQTIYEIYGNVGDIQDPDSCKNGDCDVTISIKLHYSPFTFINHTEALSTEEFIGTIGGHMGIWLGLSAVALFDLILKFIQKIKAKFL